MPLEKGCYKTRFRTRKLQPTEEEKDRAERLRRLDHVIRDSRLEVFKEKSRDLDLRISTIESLFIEPEPSTSSVGQLTWEVESLNIKQEPESEAYECEL